MGEATVATGDVVTSTDINLGTIAAGEMATVTVVVHPAAGTLKSRFTATSTSMDGDEEIQTSTVRSATPSASIDWSMPQRARDGTGDGLIDAGAPPGGYTPSSWSVTLDGCGTQAGHKTISQYRWEVQGLPEQVTSTCRHTISVPKEQVYPTKLTVSFADGSSVTATRDVKVVDRFIVVMGDSYGSGEGNPHTPIQWGSGTVVAWPPWDDVRCHRSMYAPAARAARRLETDDPHSSVTFLSRACSGATIAQGILGGYHGVEAAAGAPDLPPQLQQVRSVVGNARIDDLVISIGGNDALFAPIIADCMWPGDCFSNQELVTRFNTAVAALRTTGYPAMRTAIEDPSSGLNVDSTFITEYPDFTTNSSGNRCETIGGDIAPWPFGINKNESDWASGTVLATITNTLKQQVDAARAAGLDWNYVGGVQEAWTKAGQYGHGYCVGDAHQRDSNRWVRTYVDSCDLQGPPAGYVFGNYYCSTDTTKGMFHPNEQGSLATGLRVQAALAPKQPALDPPDAGGGDPGGGDPGGDPGGNPGGGDPGGGAPGGIPGGGTPGAGGGDPGAGGGDPGAGGGDPIVGPPIVGPSLPILGSGGPKARAGRCSTLRGKRRARCVKRACGRYLGRSKKARLKYRACVRAVTRKAVTQRR
jgi:hypothetical protein